MHNKIIKRISFLLVISASLTMAACNSNQSKVALGSTIIDEVKLKEENNLEKPAKEKNILLSSDAKKDFKGQENTSFKLEKTKELKISDENLTPVCWKNDENIIAIEGIRNLQRSYDVYNIDITNSETKKINTIKNVVGDAYLPTNNKLLFLKNFKLYSYNLINNITEEVYDLNKLIKDIEDEYEKYYIKTRYNETGWYYYYIEKRQKETDPKFIIKDDIVLSKLFKINLVDGSDKYISIISEPNQNKEDSIRIIDLETKKVVTSKMFNDMELAYNNKSGIKYNKKEDAFYIRANTYNKRIPTIYEYKLNDADKLKKLKGLTNEYFVLSMEWLDDKNFCFIGSNLNDENTDNRIMIYNIKDNKISVILKEKVENIYSDFKLSSNTKLIAFECLAKSLENKQQFIFVGANDGESIRNIQKLPVEKLYDNGHNCNSIVYNDFGDKFIYKVSYYYEKNGVDCKDAKYYIYKIDNMKSVIKCTNPIIAVAVEFLGVSYKWGGNTPEDGFDCPGFVQYVYKNCGINLTRTTYSQVKEGIEISKDDIKPGDLVFFGPKGEPHHVGIYFGNDFYIHAPRTGDVVKFSRLSQRKDFSSARRIEKW